MPVARVQGLAPLDERLGIAHGHTPAWPSMSATHLAQFVGNSPYQRKPESFPPHQIFRNPDGVDQISLHKIEQLVGRRARRAAGGSALRRRSRLSLEHGKLIAVDDEITETMVVCIDAGKAPTKGNDAYR